MIRTTIGALGSSDRTLVPVLTKTQATPVPGFLDPLWDRSEDIFPGSVMTRLDGETVTLFTGATGQTPYGLAALFVAPKHGIDDLALVGLNVFATWVGGADSQFEVLAPAFDTAATWTTPADGSRVKLGVTTSGHASGPGKLTPIVGTPANVYTKPIGELVKVIGPKKILISLDRDTFA